MTADRHLLFGLLALQNGIINQGQLLAAFQAWTLDRSKSLADHLALRGDLDEEDRAAIEALAARHLKRHGGDVEQSLAALNAGRSTRESLARLADGDIEASLAHLGATSIQPAEDTDRTASYSVGAAASDGQIETRLDRLLSVQWSAMLARGLISLLNALKRTLSFGTRYLNRPLQSNLAEA